MVVKFAWQCWHWYLLSRLGLVNVGISDPVVDRQERCVELGRHEGGSGSRDNSWAEIRTPHTCRPRDSVGRQRGNALNILLSCQACGIKLPTIQMLKTHQNRRHPLLRAWYSCPEASLATFCDKDFSSNDPLSAHQKAQHPPEGAGRQKWTCSICGKELKRPRSLRSPRVSPGFADGGSFGLAQRHGT